MINNSLHIKHIVKQTILIIKVIMIQQVDKQ